MWRRLLLRPAFLLAVALALPGGWPPAALAQPLTQVLDQPDQPYQLRYPASWSEAPKAHKNATMLVARPPGSGAASPGTEPAWMLITTESPKDHADALRRLRDIASEAPGENTFLEIGGWPALQRRQLRPLEQPGQERDEPEKMVLRITTAVAAADRIVRLEAWVHADSTPLADEAEAIGRSLTFPRITQTPGDVDREIQDLRATPAPASKSSGAALLGAESEPMAVAVESMEDTSGATVRVQGTANGTDSEIEVAISPNGQNMVIGNNSRDFATSNDGGKTFPTTGTVPVPAGFFQANGDPSLAWGRSGTFYYAYIGFPDTDGSSARDECSTAINVSTNNGGSFNTFRANAVYCNDPPLAGRRCFPDQEHIAADRVNAAPGGDQIYSVWRDFGGTCASPSGSTPSIVCSQDGGQNWTAPAVIAGAAGGDFPRVTVGQDGFVYVVWQAGGNVALQKYSSCANGLVAQFGAPVTVGAMNDVACPVPGVDRCNGRNVLASPTVAVDDTNPNHVYVAFATNTAAGNENILIRDSLDGGASFPGPRVAQLNTNIPGPRFMPWLCATGGDAFVTWYDRRAATPCPAPPCLTNNDTTEFFGGSAFLDAGGNLTPGPEFRISDIPDAQCCASGADATCSSAWPSGVNAMGDSESCWAQPQLAGRCGTVTPCCAMTDSAQACDFNQGPACPAGETCRVTRGGPKYGDYNGNACAAGRLIAAWASSTSPPGFVPASTDIDAFVSVELVGDVPVITVPGNVPLPDTCVGATSTATLNVCNTGTANLEVTSITATGMQFSVTPPSSGYPVVISPDFCFPFQVAFSPTSPGSKSATITITSNDPLNPSVQVQATGTSGTPEINAFIANLGSFGNVCRDTFHDLALTIGNNGLCSLSVSAITIMGADAAQFQLPSSPTLPIVIAPGGSLQVPIRFAPTTLGAKAAFVRIVSNDPDDSPTDVPISGTAPPGDIRVNGSTDFGDVCAGEAQDKIVEICNVGTCNLNVTSASIDCPDFTIINNPVPAPVSPDFCLGLTIRFTPTSGGPKQCTLTIVSDDPETPVVERLLTANTPLPMIDVPPDLPFPPTVVQATGACTTPEAFPVSNTGQCELRITDFAITTDPVEFALDGLPSFPIVLEPGHIAGEGNLSIVFAPDVPTQQLDRDRQGAVSVTYVSEPILNEETTVTRQLCGEAVNTGARVLVTEGGVPLASVEKIQIQRITGNRKKKSLQSVGVVQDAPLQAVVPAAPCPAFQYHYEWGTAGNPIQLLTGSYQVTATITSGVTGKRKTKTVGFSLDTCDFNANVTVDF